ncbi:unnamed protein product [Closterium sp. NIES-54]
MSTRKERSSSNDSPGTTPTPPPASGLQTEEGIATRPRASSSETPANQGAGFDPSMMEKFFSFMSFYEQHQQGAPAQSNNSNNNNNVTPMSLDGSSYARGNQQQQPTFAPYEPQRGSVSFMPQPQPASGQERTLDALQVQSQFAHVLKLQTTKPFDGKDFFTWSFEFELMMEGAQILGFFDGSLPYPTNGTQYEKQQYTYQSMMAYTILLRNITPTQQQNIRSYRGYAYAPLEKVYSDILYNREPGQGAYSYTITFIDAATRYVWHLNLPSKDMAFEAFIAWLPVAERESGEKLKSFQSDGGGEYTSQRFKQFLAEKGIKRLVSLPYAHQQQGVAERLNRTLQNTMRKLLRGMRLPNHQWPEAMDHAVMLHNLLSSSSLPNNASPHLLWTGKQGNTKMLRVFGCMVQYRPPSARAGRFSQRAQWGLHLGIEKNYNAWKIFDVHSKETVAARDVIFYERLTLPTYLANLEENRDPIGGFRGDRHFASATDEADWDEQNVNNASDEAGPLPYCSVLIPMDDENPRESINAGTYFDLADTGYVTPAAVNTNEAERVGPNFIPDPEEGDEAAYPEDATLPRYTQSGLQILGLVTAVHGTNTPKEPAMVQQALGGEHREKWREAMDRELKALKERNTWKVVPISMTRNKTILTGKWVFRVKTKADGTIDKFKARWVVRGFDQEHGRDFTETFAPAPRLWQQYLHARLTRIGFKQLPHDQGMYRLSRNDDYILLIVYVDDLLYIGSNDGITTWFEGELQQDLTLTVSSTVTHYLGLNIREEKDAIYLSTEKYADTIAKRFTFTPSAITTPYRYATGNHKEGSPLLKSAGIRNYQRKLGCLLSRHLSPISILFRKPARHLPQEA